MLLELVLVGHNVVIGAHEVFIELIVESLSRNLDANPEYDLCVDDIFLESSVQYAKMSLPRFFYRVVSLIFCAHNFIQVDLIVEKIVEL